ncbi:membrane protein [Bacillus sp. LL01]|uniref:CAP domain-containing protein n=1 Tax=Bacillus sp. LL01 TaxID=1665556 RepID=UPI00064D596B|nr:CAP domain-containing protein [Bacillus sp. LL01]KMJ58508.1 membrane protein [Bacillus sp. LL01]
MRGLFFLLFIAFCLYLFVNVEPHELESFINEQPLSGQVTPEKRQSEEKAFVQSEIQMNDNIDGLASFMGKEAEELLDTLGDPARKDLSSYDYEWWVYNQDPANYMQFGVSEGKVVTVFGTGSKSRNELFEIGQSYESLNEKYSFLDSITVDHKEGSYQFQLKPEEMKTRPLIKVDDIYIQLYFDDFEQHLSSVRYMNDETLIKQRPYELVYRGPLLDAKDLTDEEWAKVEEGNAKQIIDFTNIIRKRFDIETVEWDGDTAEVAYLHSKDMREGNYFSHVSPTRGSLTDRLMEGNVPFRLAGENIAAKYVDGVAAVEGWLNSEGHRNTLLNSRFTHLGVGVNEKYYTQNFIESW